MDQGAALAIAGFVVKGPAAAPNETTPIEEPAAKEPATIEEAPTIEEAQVVESTPGAALIIPQSLTICYATDQCAT